jgi:hypothetical protein
MAPSLRSVQSTERKLGGSRLGDSQPAVARSQGATCFQRRTAAVEFFPDLAVETATSTSPTYTRRGGGGGTGPSRSCASGGVRSRCCQEAVVDARTHLSRRRTRAISLCWKALSRVLSYLALVCVSPLMGYSERGTPPAKARNHRVFAGPPHERGFL